MCSGSCSHSPKSANSAGRKTVSDINYGPGSGRGDTGEHRGGAAAWRSHAWALSPAESLLRLIWPKFRGLVTAPMDINLPGVTHTRTRTHDAADPEAGFTSPGIMESTLIRLCQRDCPIEQLHSQGKKLHTGATEFYTG